MSCLSSFLLITLITSFFLNRDLSTSLAFGSTGRTPKTASQHYQMEQLNLQLTRMYRTFETCSKKTWKTFQRNYCSVAFTDCNTLCKSRLGKYVVCARSSAMTDSCGNVANSPVQLCAIPWQRDAMYLRY
jgi:hypothetical protein